jgi:hypothetical protein
VSRVYVCCWAMHCCCCLSCERGCLHDILVVWQLGELDSTAAHSQLRHQ